MCPHVLVYMVLVRNPFWFSSQWIRSPRGRYVGFSYVLPWGILWSYQTYLLSFAEFFKTTRSLKGNGHWVSAHP